jgi:hypothetical protein
MLRAALAIGLIAAALDIFTPTANIISLMPNDDCRFQK